MLDEAQVVDHCSCSMAWAGRPVQPGLQLHTGLHQGITLHCICPMLSHLGSAHSQDSTQRMS